MILVLPLTKLLAMKDLAITLLATMGLPGSREILSSNAGHMIPTMDQLYKDPNSGSQCRRRIRVLSVT